MMGWCMDVLRHWAQAMYLVARDMYFIYKSDTHEVERPISKNLFVFIK